MIIDNRLDFITNINPIGLDTMTQVRKAFIALDDALDFFAANPEFPLDIAGSRCLALARTNLEISLQYAIKTLCLQYELKA